MLRIVAALIATALGTTGALAQIPGQFPAGTIWGNSTGAAALPTPTAPSAFGFFIAPVPTRAGDVMYWNGSIWTTLAGNNSGSNCFTENASGVPSWGNCGASGVTSVGLNLPGIFSVSGSPVTTTGTLTGSLVTQSSNTVWAGPTTAGPTTPTFRSLVTADLPFTFPLSIANGGTFNAGLTPSNGGIVWSDATKLNVLAGTATANQIVLSGANTTPAWSTATYPGTAGAAANVLRSNGTNWLSATLAAIDLSNGVTGSGAVVLQAAPALTGLVDIQGAYKMSTQSAPAQITVDQNDYNPGSVNCATSATLLINASAAKNVTGLAGGVAGCEMRIVNTGTFAITLKDENVGSIAANRFGFGADLVLAAKQGALLNYDAVNSRWRELFVNTAGAGAGTVTSIVCNGLTISTSGTCPEPFEFENCSLAASVGANLLTVALKDASGADPSASSPCRVGFRSSTATTGSHTFDSVTAALSISTNATGATLGTAANTAFRFWVVAFDNGGTVVLSLYNASTATALTGPARCFPINEGTVQSSTAISGSAVSAGTFYTPNGTTLTSKAIRVLGYVEYNSTGLSTPGTYASGPSFIQTFSSGIKKPCDSVQVAYNTTTSANSTTSATYVTTALNQAITPTSAVNLIKTGFAVDLQVAAGANGGRLAMYRASGSCTNLVGSGLQLYANDALAQIAVGIAAEFDKPNAISSTTYTLCYRSGGVGGAIQFIVIDGNSASMYVEEIMG